MTVRTVKAGMNTLSGWGLNAFTNDELDAIHYATLEILRDVGVKVESKEATEIFEAGGCKVTRFDNYSIVKMPPYVVEECIRSTPSTVVYYGRDKKDDYSVEAKRVGFSPFGENVQVIDRKTRKVRHSTKKDLGEASLLCDYYDQVPVVERAMCSGDQYPATQTLHNFQAMVTNSSKHLFLSFGSGRNARKIIEMAIACAGNKEAFEERPFVTAFVCPTSPLTLVAQCCEGTIEAAKAGIGVAIIPMALSGATAPVPLAATIVQHNAEVLSNIVLAQLTRKGTPCTYSSCSTIMDLRFTVAAVGAPEWGMISAATAKMAQYYKLPFWGAGGHTDSKVPDTQSGYESCLTALISALAGSSVIFGAGSLESGLTYDFAKFVMDMENAERILKVVKGVDVNDLTLAVDIIKEIGPAGEFMTHTHTYEHMRKMSQSKIFDRRSRETWEQVSRGKDIVELAYAEAERILETHKPLPLPDGATEAMDSIIADYEAELKAESGN